MSSQPRKISGRLMKVRERRSREDSRFSAPFVFCLGKDLSE